MNQKINYQLLLDNIIKNIEAKERPKRLLLHSCCGPCSSYVLEYLSKYFEITVFYYNPNIYPSEEYWYRVEEQRKIIDITDAKHKIEMVEGKYEVEKFYEMTKGREDLPEGGERCFDCYEMRLTEAAKIAKSEGFDYFTTTLSISPHKNSQVLNKIGERVGGKFGIAHLPCDFKKKGGYKRSCEITEENGLYRQDYCGCIFSKRESEKRRMKKEEIIVKKSELRKKMKALGDYLEKDYLIESENAIIDKFLGLPEYKNSKSVFCYVGKHPEIDTKKILERVLEDGKILSVPFCVDKTTMVACRINSLDELVLGKFGILEPKYNEKNVVSREYIDLVVVPCSTADKNGARLGFGRGYYDRFLSGYMGEKILLIREKQMSEDIPMDKFDVMIKKIITEN